MKTWPVSIQASPATSRSRSWVALWLRSRSITRGEGAKRVDVDFSMGLSVNFKFRGCDVKVASGKSTVVAVASSGNGY